RRAAQCAEYRGVPRQPDVRPQHLRAAQAPREGRRSPARPDGRNHRRHADDPRRTSPQIMNLLELYVFMLAAFVGFMVISRVPPLLHTPLMAATNAISGISLVGSMIAAGSARDTVATILGFIAVVAASSNIVGGFLITDRMLRMFRSGNDGKSVEKTR